MSHSEDVFSLSRVAAICKSSLGEFGVVEKFGLAMETYSSCDISLQFLIKLPVPVRLDRNMFLG